MTATSSTPPARPPRPRRAAAAAPCSRSPRSARVSAFRSAFVAMWFNSQITDNRADEKEAKDYCTRDAPLADGVDREQLAVSQVAAEADADERQRHRRKPSLLAVGQEQRRENARITDQAEQRDRNTGQLRPLRRLDLDARGPSGAGRLDAGVVDVSEVGGDGEPGQGQYEDGAPEHARSQSGLRRSRTRFAVRAGADRLGRMRSLRLAGRAGVASPVTGPMRNLRYVDPHKRRGPVYRALAWFSGTKLGGWLSMKIAWRVDPHLLALTRGRFSSAWPLPAALLETRGAKTGRTRRNATLYFHDGDRVTIVASL